MTFLVNKNLNEGASLSISIDSVCLTHCMLQDCPTNRTVYWRAREASETLSVVYKFELVRYIYIYIYVWRYVCHISSACHAYVMWAELVHCHFLYVPAVLNVVTTGNGTGTKNVLEWNRALGVSSLLSTALLL